MTGLRATAREPLVLARVRSKGPLRSLHHFMHPPSWKEVPRSSPTVMIWLCNSASLRSLYQVRIDRFAFSCRLRPPVVAGVRAYELALVQQSYATIHERLLQILDLLEVAVCYPFVAQRPQPF